MGFVRRLRGLTQIKNMNSSQMDRLFAGVKWKPAPPPENTNECLPYVTHVGKLAIGEIEIDCVVLSDGQRLLTGDVMERLVAGLKDLQSALSVKSAD